MVEPQELEVENQKQPSIRVFISYSRESVDHEKRVLDLSDRLCREGIDSVLDQYFQAPPQGWAKWMLEHFETSNFIIVVCTEVYDKRSRGVESARVGKGVKFETLLTYQDLLDNDSRSDKIIPVVFRQEDLEFIPRPLRPFQSYALDTDAGYETLYRRLTGQPRIIKPLSSGIRSLKVGENISPSDSESMEARRVQEGIASKPRRERKAKTSTVELHIDRNFDEYSEAEQQSLIRAIRELLDVGADLRVKNIRRGSVILTLELSQKDAEKLRRAIRRGNLFEYGVLNIQDTPNAEPASVPGFKHEPVRHEGHEPVRHEGVVKWFNDAKGYAFIVRERGADVFVHHASIIAEGFRALSEGDRVVFDVVKDSTGGLKAVNVTKKNT